MSRAISRAEDKAAAAKGLYDEINRCRLTFLSTKNNTRTPINTATMALEAYQEDFIKFAIYKNVLQFGSFTLKSGRISPYFFNAGLFSCGQSLYSLGRYIICVHWCSVCIFVVSIPYILYASYTVYV